MTQAIFIILLISISLFMILLIMIQRGKGGGLAGAFGGMGGQSAFGTKAGDTFTKITVYTALIWFALCVITLLVLNGGMSRGLLDVDTNKTAAPSMGTLPDATSTPAPAATPSAPAENK